MNEVIFRWPDKALSPNSRGHWSKKAKAAKQYRLDCFYLTKEAGLRVEWDGPINVHLLFVPPDRRPRDMDNLLASAKSCMDVMPNAISTPK